MTWTLLAVGAVLARRPRSRRAPSDDALGAEPAGLDPEPLHPLPRRARSLAERRSSVKSAPGGGRRAPRARPPGGARPGRRRAGSCCASNTPSARGCPGSFMRLAWRRRDDAREASDERHRGGSTATAPGRREQLPRPRSRSRGAPRARGSSRSRSGGDRAAAPQLRRPASQARAAVEVGGRLGEPLAAARGTASRARGGGAARVCPGAARRARGAPRRSRPSASARRARRPAPLCLRT